MTATPAVTGSAFNARITSMPSEESQSSFRLTSTRAYFSRCSCAIASSAASALFISQSKLRVKKLRMAAVSGPHWPTLRTRFFIVTPPLLPRECKERTILHPTHRDSRELIRLSRRTSSFAFGQLGSFPHALVSRPARLRKDGFDSRCTARYQPQLACCTRHCPY